MEFSVANQQTAVVSAERIPATQRGIRGFGVRYPSAEQFDSRHLQARAAILPTKSLAVLACQACSQHLGLLQARCHQPPGLAVNFTTLAHRADACDGGTQLCVHHDPPLAAHTALLRQVDIGFDAGRHHHPLRGQLLTIQQCDAISLNAGNPGIEYAANTARCQLGLQQIAGLPIQLVLHQAFGAMN
ncbi:hypothetical protein D3C73_908080 [compost metagenome]